LIQEAPHLPAAAGVLQLPQRLGLDLEDAFVGHAERLAIGPQLLLYRFFRLLFTLRKVA
jgi:hypothetical protein